ncbi:MAG: carboxypeptidase regulatory-like domain-containing protein [Planctomycetaceae bacterium]|nr:carboxypeptidase regulatory-like domain-containing protein [Planctomycetaceae bacterium]
MPQPLRCLLLVLLYLKPSASDEVPISNGVFVRDDDNHFCVEFAEDGTFYLSTRPFRFTRGTFQAANGQLVCTDGKKTITFSTRDGNLIDQIGKTWKPREQILAGLERDCSEFVIVVLNDDTLEPVTSFQYMAEIQTDKGSRSLLTARPTTVESPDGTFRIMVPRSCLLQLDISGPDVVNGFGAFKSIEIKSSDTTRRAEVTVGVGNRVAGVVVDAETGEPVPGAVVAPMRFLSPIMAPDWEKEVTTNTQGEFVLYGVDTSMGIHAEHDAYFDATVEDLDQLDLQNVTVELRKGPSLRGLVLNLDGSPIAGAVVSDRSGKKARSGQDGVFELASPRPLSSNKYSLEIECDGYQTQRESVSAVETTPLRFVLKPLPVLRGIVRTESGAAPEEFDIAVGIGSEPQRFECQSQTVRGESAFEIKVPVDADDREQRFWIGIRAKGFAFWETEMPRWETVQSLEVTLKSGHIVTGRVTNHDRFKDPIQIHIVPQLRYLSRRPRASDVTMRQNMSRMSVALDDHGEFHFSHVAPGRYLLAISGTTVSPFSTVLDVAENDCNAGDFSLRGTGSITGIVWDEPKSSKDAAEDGDQLPSRQAFAEGTLHFTDTAGNDDHDLFPHLAPRSFQTDERGRFRIDNVPVGQVVIGLPKTILADIVSADRLIVSIVENENTEAEFFSPALRERVNCQIVVGDGTPEDRETGFGPEPTPDPGGLESYGPRFAVSLELAEDNKGSIPEQTRIELTTSEQFSISDVSPGDYELVISDTLTNRRYPAEYFRKRIQIAEDPVDVRIPLGAGSVAGVIRIPKDSQHDLCVIAVGQKTGQLRVAGCSEDGRFCLRYLDQDVFDIYARSPAGWCQLPRTTVSNNHQDLGAFDLHPGATLRFQISPKLSYDKNVSVVAVHESGAISERLSGNDLVYGPTEFQNLWPGNWDVILYRGKTELFRKAVSLEARGISNVDLRN